MKNHSDVAKTIKEEITAAFDAKMNDFKSELKAEIAVSMKMILEEIRGKAN